MSEVPSMDPVHSPHGTSSRERSSIPASPVTDDAIGAPIAADPPGLAAHASAVVDRLKGAVAGASLSLATAMSGAGATCASGRCGQGCGYACGIIGVTAAGGIAVAAIRRRLRAGSLG